MIVLAGYIVVIPTRYSASTSFVLALHFGQLFNKSTMLLPPLALDLFLSLMANSIDLIHIFFTDEFLPRTFAVGVVDVF